MVRPIVTLCLAVPVTVTARDGDDPKQSPEQMVRSIIDEVKAAKSSYEEANKKAKSDGERLKLQEDHEKLLDEASHILMLVSRKFPWHPASVDALSWVLTEGTSRADDINAAFSLLTANHLSLSLQDVNHLSDERIADLCLGLLHSLPFGQVTGFYRTVMAGTKNRRVRAIAIYALADRSRRASRDIRERLGKPPGNRLGEFCYSEAEAKRLAAEANALFEQLVDEYADVPLGTDRLGDLASANPAASATEAGRPAPEIEGVDAEGRSFKLGDYRGKVVVLSFWAGWCGPCMDLLPEERALVERMEGKAFVLLGVNSDESMEAFRKVDAEKQVRWRSWWDGPNDLISTRWDVRKWPSLYVIDRMGVLRSERFSARDVQEKKLDRLVEQLLKED